MASGSGWAAPHTRPVIAQLARDADSAPHLFRWTRSSEEDSVREWVNSQRQSVPPDLLDLWIETGGGELFETEDLLCPASTDLYDLVAVNEGRWKQGLPHDRLVFHVGIFLTAIDPGGRLLQLDADSETEIGAFSSMDAWYLDLRATYGEKYGLSLLP